MRKKALNVWRKGYTCPHKQGLLNQYGEVLWCAHCGKGR